jgi:versiconal hemiacetal acetate esterase
MDFDYRLTPYSVLNNYDEYSGLPHYFFVFPSPCLEKVRDEYHEKTAKGIKFLLGS